MEVAEKDLNEVTIMLTLFAIAVFLVGILVGMFIMNYIICGGA